MESTLSFTITLPLEHADVASLERTVAGALVKVGEEIWARLLALLERTLPTPSACTCGGRLKRNGRAPRQLVTLAGTVVFARSRFRCVACGDEFVPLDAALGLHPREAHTLVVRELGLFLATELSYARSAGLLDELRGISVSHGELHAWVREEGGRLDALREATRHALFERGETPPQVAPGELRGGEVWVSVDGTMIGGRDPEGLFEVQAGLLWTGRRTVPRGRTALVERFCDGAAGSWHAFAERFTAVCAALGVYEAERIFFVSDGAPVLERIRGAAFPTAVRLLDRYHLVEAVRRGIGSSHDGTIEILLGAAAGGDIEAVRTILRTHRRRIAGDEDALALLASLVTYIEHNAAGIANHRLVPYASSGPMEKGVDLVFCRRFKGRGMSWTRRGIAHLVALRLLRLNGAWEAYWRDRFAKARLPWPSAA